MPSIFTQLERQGEPAWLPLAMPTPGPWMPPGSCPGGILTCSKDNQLKS